MRKTAIKLFILTIFFTGIQIFHGCGKNRETRLLDALTHYSEKAPGSYNELKKAFIESIAVKSFPGQDIHTDGSALYRIQGNTIEFIYPIKQTISFEDNSDITAFNLSAKKIAVTDGIKIIVYNTRGSKLDSITPGDKKNPVGSVFIYDDRLMYIRKYHLSSYDFVLKSAEKPVDAQFPPPYKKYYRSKLFHGPGLLGIVSGIAGSYYISLIDVNRQAVVVKNISAASSKLYLSESALYYIAGTSGNWSLTRFNLAKKSKRTLHRFKKLKDIELVKEGVIFESGDSLYSSLYGEARTRVPFPYSLVGKCEGMALLRYENINYLITLPELQKKLDLLKEKTPAIFTD